MEVGARWRLDFSTLSLRQRLLLPFAWSSASSSRSRGIWPPPRQHAWQKYLMWFLFLASAGGVGALGIIEWGALALPPWVRFVVGIFLGCAGHGLAVWAMVVMGIAASFGGESTLIRRGPYRFSRNPQYVGFISALIGWGFLTSSRLTLVASSVGIIPLILVPFAEEKWLLARCGAAYEEYKRAVPRFISLRSMPLLRSPDGWRSK
jgi:protein-S-isoprenylcysteine O-methyltransferase Ste14